MSKNEIVLVLVGVMVLVSLGIMNILREVRAMRRDLEECSRILGECAWCHESPCECARE